MAPDRGFLANAFAPQRAAPAAPGTLRTADTAPEAGSGDDVSARMGARGVAVILLLLGLVIALIWEEKQAAFQPEQGFGIFAGFYIAAQAIERVLELAPAGLGTKQAKADRAVIFPAIGFVLAVVLAEILGLYYVAAVGVGDVSRELDVIITALAIGGGTKPLHDAIKRLEKAKETPQASH